MPRYALISHLPNKNWLQMFSPYPVTQLATNSSGTREAGLPAGTFGTLLGKTTNKKSYNLKHQENSCILTFPKSTTLHNTFKRVIFLSSPLSFSPQFQRTTCWLLVPLVLVGTAPSDTCPPHFSHLPLACPGLLLLLK